jgi:hypothetical protein
MSFSAAAPLLSFLSLRLLEFMLRIVARLGNGCEYRYYHITLIGSYLT